MRRLMLLRHATSPGLPPMSDRDRPLGDQGRAEARAVGVYMAREKLRPDLALVSPARRTQETWEIAGDTFGGCPMSLEPHLYAAGAETLLAVLQHAAPATGTILIVGHNPACEDLARCLARDGDPEALARLGRRYPPGGLAVIDLPIEDWGAVALDAAGHLARFVTPDMLGVGTDA